eukprot:g14306.t1
MLCIQSEGEKVAAPAVSAAESSVAGVETVETEPAAAWEELVVQPDENWWVEPVETAVSASDRLCDEEEVGNGSVRLSLVESEYVAVGSETVGSESCGGGDGRGDWADRGGGTDGTGYGGGSGRGGNFGSSSDMEGSGDRRVDSVEDYSSGVGGGGSGDGNSVGEESDNAFGGHLTRPFDPGKICSHLEREWAELLRTAIAPRESEEEMDNSSSSGVGDGDSRSEGESGGSRDEGLDETWGGTSTHPFDPGKISSRGARRGGAVLGVDYPYDRGRIWVF